MSHIPSKEELDQFVKVMTETEHKLEKLLSEQRQKLEISPKGVHFSVLANFYLNIAVGITFSLLEETSEATEQDIKKTTGIFLALLKAQMKTRYPDENESNQEPKH